MALGNADNHPSNSFRYNKRRACGWAAPSKKTFVSQQHIPVRDARSATFIAVDSKSNESGHIHLCGVAQMNETALISFKTQNALQNRSQNVQGSVVVRSIFVAAVVSVLIAALESLLEVVLILTGIDVIPISVVSATVNRRVSIVVGTTVVSIVSSGTVAFLVTGIDCLSQHFGTAVVRFVIRSVATYPPTVVIDVDVTIRQVSQTGLLCPLCRLYSSVLVLCLVLPRLSLLFFNLLLLLAFLFVALRVDRLAGRQNCDNCDDQGCDQVSKVLNVHCISPV